MAETDLWHWATVNVEKSVEQTSDFCTVPVPVVDFRPLSLKLTQPCNNLSLMHALRDLCNRPVKAVSGDGRSRSLALRLAPRYSGKQSYCGVLASLLKSDSSQRYVFRRPIFAIVCRPACS